MQMDPRLKAEDDMHLTDHGIVLSTRKFAENSIVARVFTPVHGVVSGVVRGASGKGVRGLYQPGNLLSVQWSARLAEHLGHLKSELTASYAAHIMQDALALAALTSACTLLESALPEREPHEELYHVFHTLVQVLARGEAWQVPYARFEYELLAACGYQLDLSCCAATGATSDLAYVSPKSGRAVSRAAGEPYKDKLFPLPTFWLFPPPEGGRVREGEADHRKPNRYGSHALIDNARKLRSTMTDAEKALWHYLRAHRFHDARFRRQHPVSAHYIVDFICLDKRLIIELDGGQHAQQEAYDAARTAFLHKEGYTVLRFWNNDVLTNVEGVLQIILEHLEGTPSLTLPPTGGGNSKQRRGDSNIKPTEILASLAITGYFLCHWLLEPHGRHMPAARSRLVKLMEPNPAHAA